MKFQLKDFQESAVSELRKKAEIARNGAPGRQALLLNAPTGAGKTVIAAALLESLLLGDDTYDEDPDATFLWLTDQPELNEQTKEKFLAASDQFTDRITTIEPATFDQETFDAGRLYFLNTQKLGKNSGLVKKGDDRQFSIWETIANTVRDRPKSFWLILDEAHRGMGGQNGGGESAATLVQRLILGSSEHGVEPVPLIVGITATPGPFTELLDKDQGRDRFSVVVPVEQVRASGLLKEFITLYHTDEEQPSDLSLLAAAGAKLREFEEKWAEYHRANPDSEQVRPVLVVQVEDGTGKPGKHEVSRTDLEQALGTLREVLRDLSDDEVAHAFMEQSEVNFGETRVRYVKPSAIERSKSVRVVFFKRSLSTGWDCPRAEVMMSFRKVKDEVLIAQLVGRMVRTPLGYAVLDPELLASVALYLPQYNEQTVQSVIDRLQTPSPGDGVPGTQTRRGNALRVLKLNPELEDVADVLKASPLPHARVEHVATLSPVRRLLRLGDRLALDDLDRDAKRRYERVLLRAIARERKRLEKQPDFKERIREAAQITLKQHEITVAMDADPKQATERVAATAHDIDRAFAHAGRQLAAGLERVYLRSRANEEPSLSHNEIKGEFWVVISDEGARAQIEKQAEELCESELSKFEVAIDKELSDESRAEYRAIRRLGSKVKPDRWEPPAEILGPKDGAEYEKHLYVGQDGTYRARLNSLEKEVLWEASTEKGYVGFLRNEPRKPWSFSVNYETAGEKRSMYPDFLIFRKEGDHLLTDVVEPHSLSQADSVAKAKGLADFAESYGSELGRVMLVDRVGKSLKRIDLKDRKIRKRVKSLDSAAALKQLFDDA